MGTCSPGEYRGVMSAEPIHPAPRALPVPDRNPVAIRAVLASNAQPHVLEAFDSAMADAWVQARAGNSLEPLLGVIDRWWFEAKNWCDPVGQDQFLTGVDELLAHGPTTDEGAHPSRRITAASEIRHRLAHRLGANG